MQPLLESKTLRLILLTMAIILVVFVAGAVAEIAFGVHLPYVSETYAAITGNSGIGAIRNIMTDGPIRRDQALAGNPPPSLMPPAMPNAMGGQPEP